ncbi:MAG TPA: DUF1028 domain-containing protein [Clostridia bacterium]|nr:DUF1028 domain-containing protein [Clostridia bacterium]
MIRRLFIAMMFLLSSAGFAQESSPRPRPSEFAHTFSIVARDPQTGEMGVAVQSHWFSVGSIVSWAEPGVGAVATQSFVDPSYGKLGLDLMRAGRSAPDTLLGLASADEGRDVRQVGIIDAQGRVAGYTGCNCVAEAGHRVGGTTAKTAFGAVKNGCAPTIETGKDYSVQANMMLNNKVPAAMAQAFEQTKGDLAERLMAAMEAAQAVGGDARGRQSAALIVVKAQPSGKPWEDRRFDLRVDDHNDPLVEMRRLLTLARAYNHMNAGDKAVELKNNEAALREYSTAAQIAGANKDIPTTRIAEMTYWHAQALAQMGRVDESLPLFKKAFAMYPNWVIMTPRVAKAGLLPNDPKILQRILDQAK